MKDLPQVGPTHCQETNSLRKLVNILPSNLFILRSEDGTDYGVDRIIEVIQNGNATNIRSHIQVKSTHTKISKSDKMKYPVPIVTLNYLINCLNSLFIIYNEISDIFFWEWAGVIAEHRKKSKSKANKYYSYTFYSKIDNFSIKRIHTQLINDSELIKNLNLTSNPFEKVILTELIHENTYRDYLEMYINGKYEKIIALSKDSNQKSSENYSLVSLCYYNLNNYEEALKYILKAESIETNDYFQRIKFIILCEKGIKESNQEILLNAKRLFLSINSDKWGWMDLYNFGNLLTGLKEYNEAEKCYRQAIELEPKEAKLWKNLSSIFYYTNQYDKELEYLDIALGLNENLIEALICKGKSLGNNYQRFSEGIVILKKALSLSKDKMLNYSQIYYWISSFYNSLKQYKKSLLYLNEGLTYYPGDNYLEQNKLRTLIIASEKNKSYRKETKYLLQDLCERYPDSINLKIELIKFLGRAQSASEMLPLLKETLDKYKYCIEPEVILTMDIDHIVYMLQNFDIIAQFRKTNQIGNLFFNEYDIGIAKVHSFEMRMNALLLSMFSKYKDAEENDLVYIFNEHALAFVNLSEFISEILVSDLVESTIDEKSVKLTQIITTLPKILLIELSRQIGWILQKYNYSVEIADKIIEKSDMISNWLNICLEPILKGANNILNWSKE